MCKKGENNKTTVDAEFKFQKRRHRVSQIH